jgi:hypothetical protein
MINDLPIAFRHDDMERNAYNAAFHELGLDWHWDGETYVDLLHHSPLPGAQIRHYVQAHHPHLLKAYDADFLARAIEDCASRHRQQPTCLFDWARVAGRQPGF